MDKRKPEETLEPTSKYVPANGITLHGLTWGDPQNPLLIMTHGIGLWRDGLAAPG